MKHLPILKILMIISIMLVKPSDAQVGLNKVGQSTMNFLLVGISPEACAMGEAVFATNRGVESIFYNPAGIVESESDFEVKLYITQWIADIDYMGGAAVWSLGMYGAIGLSIVTVDYGEIYGTQLLHPSEIDAYPSGYKDTGFVDNVSAYAIGLSYGKAISDRFQLGGNIRLAGQNLGQNIKSGNALKDNDATKLVFDIGVKYYTGLESFRFGMAIRNFATNIKREIIDEQLPQTFTMGAAMDLLDIFSPGRTSENTLTLSLDFVHPNNYSERLNIGAEFRIWNMLAIRSGYQTNQDLASWSAGIGFNSSIGDSDLQFNYAYSDFEIFDSVHRFSLGFAF